MNGLYQPQQGQHVPRPPTTTSGVPIITTNMPMPMSMPMPMPMPMPMSIPSNNNNNSIINNSSNNIEANSPSSQMRDDIAQSEELMNTARAMKIEAATAQARVTDARDALDILIKAADDAASAAKDMQARAEAAVAGLSSSMTLPPEGRFPTFEDLLENAQTHAAAQGYALSAGRRRKRKDGVRQLIMVQCARGGVYQDRTKPGERKRKANTRKTECEFSFNACQMKEEEGGGWELRYREGVGRAKHNHGPSWEKGMTGKWGNRRKIKESEKRVVPGEGRFQVDVQQQQQQEQQEQQEQEQQQQQQQQQQQMIGNPGGNAGNMTPNSMGAGALQPYMGGGNVDAHGDLERGRDRGELWRMGMYQTPSYA